MKNLENDAEKTSTVPQTLYLFVTMTQKRLFKASKVMRYYKAVCYRIMVSNTVRKTIIKSFTNQWAGLKDQKQQTQPEVLKITRELPVMPWRDFLMISFTGRLV
eukprot:13748636-Ditylum_brightwellii.AAC.1